MAVFSPWVPIFIAMLFLGPLAFLVTVFLPETLPESARVAALRYTTAKHAPTFFGAVKMHLLRTREHLVESLSMLKDRSVVLLLVTFLTQNPVQTAQGGILAQSVSKRFGWTLAETGYLLSLRGLITIAVLALLPLLSSCLTSPRLGRWQLTTFRKDLLLAQGSAVCLVAGSALTGGQSMGSIWAGLVISTLAVGLGSLTKALVACYVDEAHTSRLYTLTGMVETVGSLFAGPTLAWAFEAGLKLGGAWQGLPFFYVAILCVLGLGGLFFVRNPVHLKEDADEAASAS